MAKRPLVTVVDDDESVRESLPDLLNMLGYEAIAFASAEAFLTSPQLKRTSCLVLDIAMPEMSGPELVRELKLRGHRIPVVYITAHRDEFARPNLLAQGAVDCLLKPFSDTNLVTALEAAIGKA